MKKELRELIETKIQILSEKKSKDGDIMNVSVPWIKSDVKNQNGRIYPKSLLQREIARVQSSVKKGSFIGTGDHPKSGIEDVETASHIVTALSMDENGQGAAELRILPTTRGKNIQTLIRNGATLGVSARGFGEIGRDGTILDNFKLIGIDIVMNPSFKNAIFSQKNIFESLSFEEDKKNSSAPIQKKVTPGSVFLEARIAGVDPKIYAEKLNANLERQEEIESDSDLSPREVASALEEARQSGIDTSNESERKKALDIFRKQKTQKVLTEDEKAVAVAERTGSTVQLVKEVWAIEKKKKAEEQKKTGRINLSVKESIASGFGSEARPESRRISKKIIEKE